MAQIAYHNIKVKYYTPLGKCHTLEEGGPFLDLEIRDDVIKKIYTKEEERIAFYIETERGKHLEVVGMPFVFQSQEVEI